VKLLRASVAFVVSATKVDGIPNVTRRNALLAIAAALFSGWPVAAQDDQKADPRLIEAWMEEWMVTKGLEGGLHVARFVEPVYVLTKSIGWKPNPGQQDLPAVTVPKGFVTDFASIPAAFWSALRPDGEYTFPAIVHDYLYWTQTVSKDMADTIFKIGMEDLSIGTVTVTLIYNAVRFGGRSSWDGNAKLKQQGEKRILKEPPDDPKARWADWKKRPELFSD
jgi:uncharacterized protein DUF1353